MTSGEASEPLAAARKAIAEKRCDDAIQMLTALLKESPDDPEMLSLLAAAYAQNRDYPQALAYFNRSLSLRSTARGHYNVAMLYKLQGSAGSAKRELREALRLDPNYGRASQMLAELEAVEAPPQAPDGTGPAPAARAAVPPAAPPGPASPPSNPTVASAPTSDPQAAYQPAPTVYGAPPQPAPPSPYPQPQTQVERNWGKVILGGFMVGLPALLIWAAWASGLADIIGIAGGMIVSLALVAVFIKWLSASAGAYELHHWVVMILFTGLLPSLLIIKGFDIMAAGWYSTGPRRY